MTGQVKEDILSRFGELGVFVKAGKIRFNPSLLRTDEFLKEAKSFHYTNLNNETKQLKLDKDSLCFTYCQVPIVYKRSEQASLEVYFKNGACQKSESLELDSEISKSLFERKDQISHIIVSIQK